LFVWVFSTWIEVQNIFKNTQVGFFFLLLFSICFDGRKISFLSPPACYFHARPSLPSPSLIPLPRSNKEVNGKPHVEGSNPDKEITPMDTEESDVQEFIDEHSGTAFYLVLSDFFARALADPNQLRSRSTSVVLDVYRHLRQVTLDLQPGSWDSLVIAELLFDELLRTPSEDPKKLADEVTDALLSASTFLGMSSEGELPHGGWLIRLLWLHGNHEEYYSHFQNSEKYFAQCEKKMEGAIEGDIVLHHCQYALFNFGK
jgi:hypothetical protein